MDENLYSQHKPQGDKVRKLLKSLNIKSPSIDNRIEIKPGLWVVPNKPLLTEEDKEAFINKWKNVSGLDLVRIRKGGTTEYFK